LVQTSFASFLKKFLPSLLNGSLFRCNAKRCLAHGPLIASRYGPMTAKKDSVAECCYVGGSHAWRVSIRDAPHPTTARHTAARKLIAGDTDAKLFLLSLSGLLLPHRRKNSRRFVPDVVSGAHAIRVSVGIFVATPGKSRACLDLPDGTYCDDDDGDNIYERRETVAESSRAGVGTVVASQTDSGMHRRTIERSHWDLARERPIPEGLV
jgi:hypothetical protein